MRSDLTKDKNSFKRVVNLVIVDEKRDQTLIRIVEQRRSVEDYYNKVIRFKSLSIEDWVLKRVFPKMNEWMERKLGANWEDPYPVKEIIPSRANILKNA